MYFAFLSNRSNNHWRKSSLTEIKFTPCAILTLREFHGTGRDLFENRSARHEGLSKTILLYIPRTTGFYIKVYRNSPTWKGNRGNAHSPRADEGEIESRLQQFPSRVDGVQVVVQEDLNERTKASDEKHYRTTDCRNESDDGLKPSTVWLNHRSSGKCDPQTLVGGGSFILKERVVDKLLPQPAVSLSLYKVPTSTGWWYITLYGCWRHVITAHKWLWWSCRVGLGEYRRRDINSQLCNNIILPLFLYPCVLGWRIDNIMTGLSTLICYLHSCLHNSYKSALLLSSKEHSSGPNFLSTTSQVIIVVSTLSSSVIAEPILMSICLLTDLMTNCLLVREGAKKNKKKKGTNSSR